MKFFCAVLFFALALPSLAMAQGVPRIKAVLVSFDGKLLTVKTGDPEPMQIGLMPDTRIVKQDKRLFADIKPGEYIGATIITGKDGLRRAQEVHVLPESLRGSGEGLYAMDSTHFMIGGAVTDTAPNLLTVHFRGASAADSPTCTGRAPRIGGCESRADIIVAAGVPVTALVEGDPSLLVPGAVLAISLLAGPDGHPVTPGLTVEGMEVVPISIMGRTNDPPVKPGPLLHDAPPAAGTPAKPATPPALRTSPH